MILTTFASGSTGNCALVSSSGGNILIDAGISMKRIRENLSRSGLAPEDLAGILMTHEHSDHISGLAMLTKHHSVPVYAPGTLAGNLRRAVPGVENCLRVFEAGRPFELGGMTVTAFHTSHDTDESVGYRIEYGCALGFATDMGCVTDEVENALLGCGAVLIEANHDRGMLARGPYPPHLKHRILSPWGHLSNDDCARLAVKLADAGAKYIVLGHLSRENNTPERAYDTVRAALGGREVYLAAAPMAGRLTVCVEETEPCSP
ncbi:MAG: MBL fold metallo-hydrolase [Butyricicoccus sp.]|nr:MBL fold metallo-hydrolase [Butyricicoccus sp.]